jgi:hypothetical protein
MSAPKHKEIFQKFFGATPASLPCRLPGDEEFDARYYRMAFKAGAQFSEASGAIDSVPNLSVSTRRVVMKGVIKAFVEVSLAKKFRDYSTIRVLDFDAALLPVVGESPKRVEPRRIAFSTQVESDVPLRDAEIERIVEVLWCAVKTTLTLTRPKETDCVYAYDRLSVRVEFIETHEQYEISISFRGAYVPPTYAAAQADDRDE